ncbi:MAG: DUF1003 domain-containing protein [bacterium]|nr:DUF1003 domain-containing protein [bacterium]
MDTTVTLPSMATVEDHPLVTDVNAASAARLTGVERLCKSISDATGAPIALFLVIVIQTVWIVVGQLTKLDPYPFAFLLTVSNVIQLVMIFIIAVAQRQSSQYAELRAESDHDHISRLLYHQQVQEQLLLRLAERTQADVGDLKAAISTLLTDV